MPVSRDTRLYRLYFFLFGILVALSTPLSGQKLATSRLEAYAD